MLHSLLPAMGVACFFHSSPSPCYIVLLSTPRDPWNHGEQPEQGAIQLSVDSDFPWLTADDSGGITHHITILTTMLNNATIL